MNFENNNNTQDSTMKNRQNEFLSEEEFDDVLAKELFEGRTWNKPAVDKKPEMVYPQNQTATPMQYNEQLLSFPSTGHYQVSCQGRNTRLPPYNNIWSTQSYNMVPSSSPHAVLQSHPPMPAIYNIVPSVAQLTNAHIYTGGTPTNVGYESCSNNSLQSTGGYVTYPHNFSPQTKVNEYLAQYTPYENNKSTVAPIKQSRRMLRSNHRDQTCVNCATKQSSLWRRDTEGQSVCNACGLYFKLHTVKRPLTLCKSTVQQRRRKPKKKPAVANAAAVSQNNTPITPPVPELILDLPPPASDLVFNITVFDNVLINV